MAAPDESRSRSRREQDDRSRRHGPEGSSSRGNHQEDGDAVRPRVPAGGPRRRYRQKQRGGHGTVLWVLIGTALTVATAAALAAVLGFTLGWFGTGPAGRNSGALNKKVTIPDDATLRKLVTVEDFNAAIGTPGEPVSFDEILANCRGSLGPTAGDHYVWRGEGTERIYATFIHNTSAGFSRCGSPSPPAVPPK
jgi:hypothetical protein